MLEASAKNMQQVRSAFVEMLREGKLLLKREGFAPGLQRHDRFLSARYRGQSFELEIPWEERSDIAAVFHLAHKRRYGYVQPDNAVELVSARLRSRGLVDQVQNSRTRFKKRMPARANSIATVVFAEGALKTSIFSRDELRPGMTLSSPAVVTEYSSTTLIPPNARASVDELGNIVIDLA